MNKRKVLNPKEQLFCSHYTAIGTPTFCHAERSAIQAGYSEKSARNSATALLKRADIQKRIAELNNENLSRNRVTTDKVLRDLENTRILALDKQDLSTATRCSELQGKYLALFHSDKQQPENPFSLPGNEEDARILAQIGEEFVKRKYLAPENPENENVYTHVPQTAGA